MSGHKSKYDHAKGTFFIVHQLRAQSLLYKEQSIWFLRGGGVGDFVSASLFFSHQQKK